MYEVKIQQKKSSDYGTFTESITTTFEDLDSAVNFIRIILGNNVPDVTIVVGKKEEEK